MTMATHVVQAKAVRTISLRALLLLLLLHLRSRPTRAMVGSERRQGEQEVAAPHGERLSPRIKEDTQEASFFTGHHG